MSFWVVNAQPKDRLRLNILCKIRISASPLAPSKARMLSPGLEPVWLFTCLARMGPQSPHLGSPCTVQMHHY